MNHQKPALRRVVNELLPVAGAARHARQVVTDACTSWDLACLVPSAALIVSELVSNVVDHAHTVMTVEVAVKDSCLYLAVRDGGDARPALRQRNGVSDERGRGLRLIAAVSCGWGYVADDHGKTVWATLTLPTS